MRAIQFGEFGGPEVLRLDEVELPEPASGQVRVAVREAGVNQADCKIRAGEMGEPALPHRPGLEMSGVVDVAGPDAPFAPGDEVFGWARGGSYADYALGSVLCAKPADLSWRDAAGLPVAGEAALRGLRLLDPQRGDVLLVHGASGRVGAIVTSFAVRRGVTVIGTGGTANMDHIAALGATPVHYGEGLVERVRAVSSSVDAVFDAAGAGALPDSITLRGQSTERIVTIADSAAFELGITFSSGAAKDKNTDVLTELATSAVTGALPLRWANSYPLAEAARAQREVATGHSGGKVTLQVS